MSQRRPWPLALLPIVLGTLVACAAPDPLDEGPTSPTSPVARLALEPPIDRAWLPDVRDWRAVDRQHLVLWQTPSRPYLVRLQQPMTLGASTALALGLKRNGSYLTKFDAVILDGWEYRIDSLWAITREQGDALTGRGPDS